MRSYEQIEADLIAILTSRQDNEAVNSFISCIVELKARYGKTLSTRYLKQLVGKEQSKKKSTDTISRLITRAKGKGLFLKQENRYYQEPTGTGFILRRETLNFLCL